MSGILIDVEARTAKAEQNLADINRSLLNIEKSTVKSSEALKNMFRQLGGLAAGALSLSYIKNVSTEFTDLGNKIAVVTGRTEELVNTQKALFKIAEQTRGSLQGTVDVFSSFGRSLKSLNAPTEKILRVTKTVQEALAITGGSAQAANAAIVQLGQGLASGTLRGEELNSVFNGAKFSLYQHFDD